MRTGSCLQRGDWRNAGKRSIVADGSAVHSASGAGRRRRGRAGDRWGRPNRTRSRVDSATVDSAAGSGGSCCSDLGPFERARRHGAAGPGLDHGDKLHEPIVSSGQCECTDQCLLALRRRRGRCRQQLFHHLGRGERAGRPGGRQCPNHGAGQCHRPDERSGHCTGADQRPVLCLDIPGRGRQHGQRR